MCKYALALVNIKGLGVKTFSYLIPDEMKNIIKIGQAILVPFGRQGLINAFCVGFSALCPRNLTHLPPPRAVFSRPCSKIRGLQKRTRAQNTATPFREFPIPAD